MDQIQREKVSHVFYIASLKDETQKVLKGQWVNELLRNEGLACAHIYVKRPKNALSHKCLTAAIITLAKI